MIDLNFKVCDGIFIDPKEFFDKTRDIELELERLIYDNQRVRLKQHIDGYDLKRVDLNDAQKYALDMFGEDIVEFKED